MLRRRPRSKKANKTTVSKRKACPCANRHLKSREWVKIGWVSTPRVTKQSKRAPNLEDPASKWELILTCPDYLGIVFWGFRKTPRTKAKNQLWKPQVWKNKWRRRGRRGLKLRLTASRQNRRKAALTKKGSNLRGIVRWVGRKESPQQTSIWATVIRGIRQNSLSCPKVIVFVRALMNKAARVDLAASLSVPKIKT